LFALLSLFCIEVAFVFVVLWLSVDLGISPAWEGALQASSQRKKAGSLEGALTALSDCNLQ
jgi:hypothetical protein